MVGAALVVLALAGPAPAKDGESNRILVLPVEVRDRETATFQTAVTDAVREGLLRGQHRLVEGDEGLRCASHECAGEAARTAGAQFAVRVTVVASDRVYELAIARARSQTRTRAVGLRARRRADAGRRHRPR